MSNTRTQGTLDFHLLAVVTSLTADGQPFSAHDITNRLRKRVNDGEIEIIGRAYVKIGGVDTQIINHAEVRDLVHSCFEQNQFPGLDRNNNGQYWIYSPVSATPPSANVITTAIVPGAHPFFGGGQLTPPPANAPFSAPTNFPAPSNGGTGGVTCVTGIAHVSLPPAPVAPAPVAAKPAVDPLERYLVKQDKPVIRLRHKATGNYLRLGNKTRWNRRCDLSQTWLYKSQIKSYVDAGDVEIVAV